MGLGARAHTHKSELKKETNDDTLRHTKNPGNHQCHRSMTSHFNTIKKSVHKVSKKGNVNIEKQPDGVKNP